MPMELKLQAAEKAEILERAEALEQAELLKQAEALKQVEALKQAEALGQAELLKQAEASETGGGSGTGGGTETTENGNFPPPAGTYRDDNVWNIWHDTSDDTKVSKLDENTTRITGRSKITSGNGGGQAFGFDISKWKKTIKDGKESKSEAVDIVVETGYNFTDISIVYYYDSSTLEITFKSKTKSRVDDCLFKGKKISE